MVQNPVYYTSTSEIPKFNWDIINETHNYKYLFKDEANIFKDDEVLTLFTEDKPEDIYNHLWTEYIDKHGLNDKMVLWFEYQREIAELRTLIALQNENWRRPFLKVKEFEAEKLMKEMTVGNPAETKVLLSKYMGHRVDDRIIPVDEWMAMIKQASNDSNKGQ
jgi:hypothetical protein